jgi:phosphoribosylamine-glycine ligase
MFNKAYIQHHGVNQDTPQINYKKKWKRTLIKQYKINNLKGDIKCQ